MKELQDVAIKSGQHTCTAVGDSTRYSQQYDD